MSAQKFDSLPAGISAGVCFYPELTRPEDVEGDLRKIADSGLSVVRMGEGAWWYWEPKEGVFQFEIFDRAIAICEQLGLKVIMGTPTYCCPAWVVTKYPEVLRRDVYRLPMRHGSRRNLNYSSPKYLELCDKLVSTLVNHYKSSPAIIGWQIDNEFNCHMASSYAPCDTAAFRKWCKERYVTIDKLNDVWGARFWSQMYDDFEQVDLPGDTPAQLNPHQVLDEARFISDGVTRFAARQVAILRQANPHWFITHNGLFDNINGENLSAQLDIFSHDQYPTFWDNWPSYAAKLIEARSLSEPFMILEQQSGPTGQTCSSGGAAYLNRTPQNGEVRLWAWQAVAHGAKMVSFFLWRTNAIGAEQHWHGLVESDGADTAGLHEAKLFAKEIKSLPRDFVDSKVNSAVGVLRDYESETHEAKIQNFVKDGAKEWQRWTNAMIRRHVDVNLTWLGQDWSHYRLLVVPHIVLMDDAIVAKLRAYVEHGGTLVVGARSGMYDRAGHTNWKNRKELLALAGVEVQQFTTLAAEVPLMVTGTLVRLHGYGERLHPVGAESFSRWTTDDPRLRDSSAITVRVIGKGKVIYIGGYCSVEAIDAIAPEMLRFAGISASHLVSAPLDVELVHRKSPAAQYVVALNHTHHKQKAKLHAPGHEILSNRDVSMDVLLQPFGVVVVRF